MKPTFNPTYSSLHWSPRWRSVIIIIIIIIIISSIFFLLSESFWNIVGVSLLVWQRSDSCESVISFQTNSACVRIRFACSDQVLGGVVDSGSVSLWSLSLPPPSEPLQSVNYNSTRASSNVKFTHISSRCILVGRNRFSEQSQLVWVQNLSWRCWFCWGCNVGRVHLWVFLSAGDCEAFLIICVVFPSPCSPFSWGLFFGVLIKIPVHTKPKWAELLR